MENRKLAKFGRDKDILFVLIPELAKESFQALYFVFISSSVLPTKKIIVLRVCMFMWVYVCVCMFMCIFCV